MNLASVSISSTMSCAVRALKSVTAGVPAPSVKVAPTICAIPGDGAGRSGVAAIREGVFQNVFYLESIQQKHPEDFISLKLLSNDKLLTEFIGNQRFDSAINKE